MELLFLAVFCLHILKTEAVVGHWCYRSQKCELPQCKGPAQWQEINVACEGDKQSPVNIVTRNAEYDGSLQPLTFEGYDVKGSAKWDLQNNGHTVKVALDTSPKIGGGGLERKYKAVEFHFHWGVLGEQQNTPGSEHSIDGEKYPMELHIVHIREDVSDVTEAKKTTDGLAVLAFFVKADKQNENYETLLSELKNIKYKGQLAKVDPLPLSSLLPPEEDLGRYYRYLGSLTTPDCYQGVIWTIFETPVELSQRQLSQFAALHFDGKNSTPMMENFRPVQLLNTRKVLWSGAGIALPTAQPLLLALALTCTLSSLSH
ncbi:carbonic anhydrase 4 [Pyrgilauda ruficollis]|uniref:carbonic anhydrase 4 n=1 Tax=Pyrgilauda ruficollis TaxID=221976 RepID=UPI001B86E032|nr:carbonic anhydrase 4 [Pyrgilauda ruficollis]